MVLIKKASGNCSRAARACWLLHALMQASSITWSVLQIPDRPRFPTHLTWGDGRAMRRCTRQTGTHRLLDWRGYVRLYYNRASRCCNGLQARGGRAVQARHDRLARRASIDWVGCIARPASGYGELKLGRGERSAEADALREMNLILAPDVT